MSSDDIGDVYRLLTTRAVRERCDEILEYAGRGELTHFEVDDTALPATADYVIDTIRESYPDLAIPFHSRWRHFCAGAVPRWERLQQTLVGTDLVEVARRRFELVITSVLLDAGAGDAWSYREPGTGLTLTRSEGLAVASLHWFETGALSSAPHNNLQVDAAGLAGVTRSALCDGFQVCDTNPLIGVEGRVALLHGLGEAVGSTPHIFGTADTPRLGHLCDYVLARAVMGVLPARQIFDAVLEALGSIWPKRIVLGGVNLGDCWTHAAIRRNDLTNGLVPFHKLSQWLTYSLIEPLEGLGVVVTEIDELTGLAEYRNGGLFIDLGVLRPRDPGVLGKVLAPGSEIVVEWRALTVALLDRLAPLVRQGLGLTREALPLAKMLEGGTWSAGRRIAKTLRPAGGPPLTIISDGTLF